MKIKQEKGFTLIEVIVVAGIIAILAGILVPLIFKEIDESKITRASADIRSISAAMMVFRKDIADWPVMDNTCNPNVTLLRGDGNLYTNLADLGYNSSGNALYDDHLSIDTNSCYGALWKGPYMARVSADPWGNSYVTNAASFSISGQPVWIISGGPNKQLETPSFSTSVFGDDIGIRLK